MFKLLLKTPDYDNDYFLNEFVYPNLGFGDNVTSENQEQLKKNLKILSSQNEAARKQMVILAAHSIFAPVTIYSSQKNSALWGDVNLKFQIEEKNEMDFFSAFIHHLLNFR